MSLSVHLRVIREHSPLAAYAWEHFRAHTARRLRRVESLVNAVLEGEHG